MVKHVYVNPKPKDCLTERIDLNFIRTCSVNEQEYIQ